MDHVEKKLKVNNANVTGFSLQWQSKKSSSMRTVAVAQLMEEVRKVGTTKNAKSVRTEGKKAHILSNQLYIIETNQQKRVTMDRVNGLKFGPTPNLNCYN